MSKSRTKKTIKAARLAALNAGNSELGVGDSPTFLPSIELRFSESLLPPSDVRPSVRASQITADWFFCGLKNLKLVPKKGIDKGRALRHMATIIESWEPAHEVKTAAVARLFDLWFEDFTWERLKEEA